MPENNDHLSKKTGPAAQVLIGMALALGVFVALFLIDFTWSDLLWCIPALTVSALLVFRGSKRLKR